MEQALEMCRTRQHVTSSIDQLAVRVYGDTAIVTGRTRATADGAAAQTVTLRLTDVFVRRDGRWSVVASHATRATALVGKHLAIPVIERTGWTPVARCEFLAEFVTEVPATNALPRDSTVTRRRGDDRPREKAPSAVARRNHSRHWSTITSTSSAPTPQRWPVAFVRSTESI